MSMLLQFKYILFLSLIVLLHGKKKEKRDLSDLRDDPILSSVFTNDVKEKRIDRSTSFKDELLAAQQDKSKHDELSRILFPNKFNEKRATDPLAELVNTGLQNKPLTESSFVTSSSKTSSLQGANQQQNLPGNLAESQEAVNPALFQSNFMPLPAEASSKQEIVTEARRSFVPIYPFYSYPWQQNGMYGTQPYLNRDRSFIANYPVIPMNTRLKDIPQSNSNELASKRNAIPPVPAETQDAKWMTNFKKSLIPLPFVPDKKSDIAFPSKSSFPVQLRVKSQNENLRGVVPHVTEYGETVESIRQVQRAFNYRKDFIAQPQPQQTQDQQLYDSALYKKTNIPQPESPKQLKFSKKSKTKKTKKKNSKKSKKNAKSVRQNIPFSPIVQSFVPIQQYTPYITNLQQSQQNPYSMQLASLQQVPAAFAAPTINPAAQVLNMDGFHTRPIITEEECADQYQTCVDFAKNSYCTNYEPLMRIQCRKSCGFCVPPVSSSMAGPVVGQPQVATKPQTHQVENMKNDTLEADTKHDVPNQADGSGTVESGSGSGYSPSVTNEEPTVSSSKRAFVNTTLAEDEVGAFNAESGYAESGDSESGHSESGEIDIGSGNDTATSSGANEDISPINALNKMPILNGARSKIPHVLHVKASDKPGLGEFSLPTKKSVIPHAAIINANADTDSSGSGSGSGDESADESEGESGNAVTEETESTKNNLVKQSRQRKPAQFTKTLKSVKNLKPETKKASFKNKKNAKVLKSVSKSKKFAKTVKAKPTKKKSLPTKPSPPGAYPKIDLKSIASALAHYEEAALELAGEYPKPAQVDLTEYTRSFIPHPVDKTQENVNRYKQNLQIAKLLTEDREKKTVIPKFLRLSKDVFNNHATEEEKNPSDADSLESVRQRFIIPGVEPTLNDYYAETGKVNPFLGKSQNSKKSKIETMESNKFTYGDPYEYIRNMPSGASMEPIVDPKAGSNVHSDHSYPIFLMKVSPGDTKYIDEPAERRGKIRKLDAEGLPISEKKKEPALVPNPQPAKIAQVPHPQVPKYPNPFPAAQYALPSQYRAPQVEQPVPIPAYFQRQAPVQPAFQAPSQETQANAPWFQNSIEQVTAPHSSAMFANEEQVLPEKQPGTDTLRSKMLSAFFSMKNSENGMGDEGIFPDGGSGDGAKRDDISQAHVEHDVGSGGGETSTRKSTISLHNLLFHEAKDKDNEITLASGKAASQRPKPQDASANYLQSNLAALTPEKASFETQSGLASGRLGAQFTMNKMSKTQETNWMRPNAQSELASAMPESSSSNVEATSHAVPSVERSTVSQQISTSLPEHLIEDQRPALRNIVPRVPLIKKTVSQTVGTSKTIVPSNIFTDDQQKIEAEQKHKLEVIQQQRSFIEREKLLKAKYAQEKRLQERQSRDKILNKKKIINNDFFAGLNEDLSAHKLALQTSQDPFNKNFLMEFPKSPFAAKSYIPSYGVPNNILNNNPYSFSYMQNKLQNYNNNNVRNNIVGVNTGQASAYSWRQYVPYIQKTKHNIASAVDSPAGRHIVVNDERTSLLAAKAGAAEYNVKKMIVPMSVNAINNKLSLNGQYAGSNNLINTQSNIHPLSFTTMSAKNEIIQNPVRKNLIKQKPDLDCGENWEGAQGDFGTFCYKTMTMKSSFDNALAECRRMKSDLFSILNAYENRYLQDNIHDKFWIGYRDKGMNGNWNWTDGSRSIYTNWGKENVDTNSKSHDCVYVDGEEGEWKDESCFKKKMYLCKKKIDTCPKDWKNLKLNSANGCYKLFTDEKAWEDAERLCQNQQAHLASITSDDEQTMVYQVHSSKSFWIGFNDKENEGDWQWTDRVTSSYKNWADKSPNNGGISCATMVEGGKWNDVPCQEKLKFVCKRKGPKPEKVEGLDDDGILLPVARLLNNAETAPSHVYDDLGKIGPRPVVPIYFWPLLKTTKSGMAGNRPMAVHGDARYVPGGIALDGVRSFLDGGDFHGKCIAEPDKCQKGFAVALQVYFDNSVRGYKKPHCVIDTSGGGYGFTIYIQDNKLNYKVITNDETWELKTDLTVGIWQDIVMTWHKGKGITVYVNGAYKDSEGVGKATDGTNGGTTRLIIGRENKDKGPYVCTKMVIASVAIYTKVLSVEDVPYAFTYGDTVVATYRWLMSGIKESVVPGASDIDIRKTATDVDGGIYIDGEKGWLEIDDFDPVLYNIPKAKHGFTLSFKIKFDQRVREYKDEKYVLDTGGHVGGSQGVSVYIVDDNLYFQVISSPQEDIMIWRVRVPIYTVRWQRVVMTWRLDKGLWIYLDGTFRGHTKIPVTLPEQSKDTPRRFLIGRKNMGPDYAGAQFAFGSLGVFGRYLSHQETDNVFGGADNPFPGIIREVWKNTPGENVSSLRANPDFPNNPSTIEIIENFDSPFNVESNYGSKLKGYFIAPETGNSTFYLSCSKQCELYFSSDEEAKNKTKIISLEQPTWHNQWNKFENQSSDEIFLVAGKYYYLEAIHKGVDASDSLSVGVRMPTGRYQRPVVKENLQWRLPGNPHAGLIREVWYDVAGYTISDLTSNTNFPNRPSSIEVLDKFDAPYNYADNYGSRISGYFHAPETGDYRFYLASDSSGELWLSSDDSENNLVKVITLEGWTDHNQWLKYPEQRSDKVFLAAGHHYFMRGYMKAEKLGDCLSVAVELPSGHFEGPIKKKHLSWKLLGARDGLGPKEISEAPPIPVGLFALNDASVKDILLPGENKLKLGDVDLTDGPGGLKDDAFMFKGNRTSYIEIPNDGKLDVKHSITLLANIYPMGDDGPIINYKNDGWGVHLWQFSKTQLFARFVTRDGKMSTQPLGARVLELNRWNQIGASYDHKSGVAQIWHDGKLVKSRNIGQIELLTNAPIRLGAREGDDRYYKGKISCIQIYDKSLREDQIGDLKHCPKSKSKLQPSIENDELTVFAQGSGLAPDLEEVENAENRIGDDTEEELAVQGEKNKVSKCEPNPCRNEGVCEDDDKKIDGFICKCSDDYTGKHCQVSKPAAENPVVKRTEIPKTYEKKEGTETYAKEKANATDSALKNSEESKEDISLLYQKLGCFKDDFVHHDMKTNKVNLKKVTQEECAKACALEDKSFSYFGLQKGKSCYCGRNYMKYGKVDDDNCSLKCEGNKNENCGGENANDIFFFGLGTNYTVKTFTGRKPGAGTDAKIFVEFIGERGSSDFRQLDSHIEKYEPGSVDQQTFVLPDLGKLKRMKILHDNSGSAPSWYLEKVQVTDEEGSTFEFPCNDWLSDTQSGGKLERELQGRSVIISPT